MCYYGSSVLLIVRRMPMPLVQKPNTSIKASPPPPAHTHHPTCECPIRFNHTDLFGIIVVLDQSYPWRSTEGMAGILTHLPSVDDQSHPWRSTEGMAGIPTHLPSTDDQSHP